MVNKQKRATSPSRSSGSYEDVPFDFAQGKQRATHVIFDWAGTLYDDQYPSYLTTKQVIKELSGRKITFEQYRNDFCLPVLPFYRQYGVDLTLAIINEYFFSRYTENCFKGELYQGVRQTFRQLKKQKISMSILSTLDETLLLALCRRLKIEKYFCKIQGSVCDKRRDLKKHLKDVKQKPTQVIFFGDTDHDVEAANIDGVYSACVLNGYQPLDRLLKAQPVFIFNNQEEWLSFFKTFQSKKKKSISSTSPIATSGALIFNDKEEALFVLTHKWQYTYGIPGGKIKKGETAAQAAVREIKEETGLTIKINDLIIVQDCINPPEFYITNQHFLLFNYSAQTKSKKVTLNNEGLSYVWLKPEEALSLRLNKPTQILVKEYLKTITNNR
ncbi:MAG: HAD hydrolase-like protein [bacterium]